VRLFLSPHPDDVPLSCGATVYHLRESQGEACVILTLMSGDPPDPLPDTPIVRELHARWAIGDHPAALRREEDEQAALVLSAKTIIHTRVTDCIYRTSAKGEPLYPDGASIFGTIHPDDPLPLALIATPLPYLDQLTHLYAPLGVGNHVDHQIVRDWALQLARQHPTLEVWFYEDYPYSEQESAVETAHKFYRTSLTPMLQPLREMDVLIKLTALQHYRSQISSFWSSIEEMDQKIQAYMRRVGGQQQLMERFWRVQFDNSKDREGES
jgi:LmbE family N-acetylglucosaminyl deacetylase